MTAAEASSAPIRPLVRKNDPGQRVAVVFERDSVLRLERPYDLPPVHNDHVKLRIRHREKSGEFRRRPYPQRPRKSKAADVVNRGSHVKHRAPESGRC